MKTKWKFPGRLSEAPQNDLQLLCSDSKWLFTSTHANQWNRRRRDKRKRTHFRAFWNGETMLNLHAMHKSYLLVHFIFRTLNTKACRYQQSVWQWTTQNTFPNLFISFLSLTPCLSFFLSSASFLFILSFRSTRSFAHIRSNNFLFFFSQVFTTNTSNYDWIIYANFTCKCVSLSFRKIVLSSRGTQQKEKSKRKKILDTLLTISITSFWHTINTRLKFLRSLTSSPDASEHERREELSECKSISSDLIPAKSHEISIFFFIITSCDSMSTIIVFYVQCIHKRWFYRIKGMEKFTHSVENRTAKRHIVDQKGEKMWKKSMDNDIKTICIINRLNLSRYTYK